MFRFRCSFVFLFLLALAAVVRAGEVETRGGKNLQGAVTIDGTDAVIRSPQAEPTRVPLAEIRGLTRSPGEWTSAAANAGPLPSPWQSRDIGRVRIPGKATIDAAGFTVWGSGWGAWAAKDSFHFLYQPFKGDGQIVAHVTNLPVADTTATASIMIRAGIEADARFVDLHIMPNGEARMGCRPLLKDKGFSGTNKPQRWLRLVRRGNLFITSASEDGDIWQPVDQREVELPADALWGVGAWTATNAILAEVKLDRVDILPGPAYATFAIDSPYPARGVVLVDGTQIPATSIAITDNGAKLTRPAGELAVPLDKIACLIYSPVSARGAKQFEGKTGALLPSGDFYEGDFAGIKDGNATINSVILGPSVVPVETGLVAIALRRVNPASAACSVRAADGALWLGTKLSFEKDAVVIETLAHGVQRIAAADVTAITAP